MRVLALLTVMCWCANVLAQEIEIADQPPATQPLHGEHAEELNLPHTPVLPADARWAGVTTMLILASFVAAASVGIVVYAEAPAIAHAAHSDSHDEPLGHGHDSHGQH